MAIKCGHCKESHDTVQEVKDCHILPAAPTRSRPATENQMNYAHRLLRERKPYGIVEDVELSNSIEAAHEYLNGMDFNTIRDFIGRMKAQPLRDQEERTLRVLVGEGMYKLEDGTIVKVQRAVHGSGHLYAKKLETVNNSGRFVFAPGLLSALTPDDQMSLEDAKEFGHLYGFCVRCGRTLTDEDSIAAGIGPICAGKEGWA